ncbi:MAG TPA: ribonuclease P protein component [Desulfomonilaceae bacterium]|nr:ribonuclease P protein component [Desulfomonilaceae bacterium]
MVQWSSKGEGQEDASVLRSESRRFTFPGQHRICRSSEYRKIMERGTRHRTPHFQIRMLRNPLGLTRLGIAAGKKVGKACARNRIKRRLREYFRLNRDSMPPETDIVFIPLHSTAALNTKQLREELDRFFAKEYRPPAGMPPED